MNTKLRTVSLPGERSVGRGFVLPCRAAELRGALRHSHLQNRFLTWLPGSPDLVRRTYGEDSPARQQMEQALKELGTLIEDPAAGFSPVPLLESLPPLRGLPDRIRENIIAAMLTAYTNSFDPETRAAELCAASSGFLTCLDEFLACAEVSSAVCEGLRAAAQGLYQEISKLPKGIWLWPEEEQK